MSKLKYYYDSESLSYRKIERKKSDDFPIHTNLFIWVSFPEYVFYFFN